MELYEKTTLIQHELLRRGQSLPRFGADGDFGDEMADALMVELGIEPKPNFTPVSGLVTGAASNINRVWHCSEQTSD